MIDTNRGHRLIYQYYSFGRILLDSVINFDYARTVELTSVDTFFFHSQLDSTEALFCALLQTRC